MAGVIGKWILYAIALPFLIALFAVLMAFGEIYEWASYPYRKYRERKKR